MDGSGETTFLVASGFLAPGELRTALAGSGVELDEFREHRTFLEARVRFDSPEALCATPLLARECAHQVDGDGNHRIRMAIPPDAVPGDGSAEITLRPAGRIIKHNLDAALRRGNRLVWAGPIAALRDGGLQLEVTTEPRSVLAITIGTFLRATLVAFGLAGCGLASLYLVGRRRLRREPHRWTPADPAGGTPHPG